MPDIVRTEKIDMVRPDYREGQVALPDGNYDTLEVGGKHFRVSRGPTETPPVRERFGTLNEPAPSFKESWHTEAECSPEWPALESVKLHGLNPLPAPAKDTVWDYVYPLAMGERALWGNCLWATREGFGENASNVVLTPEKILPSSEIAAELVLIEIEDAAHLGSDVAMRWMLSAQDNLLNRRLTLSVLSEIRAHIGHNREFIYVPNCNIDTLGDRNALRPGYSSIWGILQPKVMMVRA